MRSTSQLSRTNRAIHLTKFGLQGRNDARLGIFRPPVEHPKQRAGTPGRATARDEYSAEYWREFERARFERGEYDLL